jgi:hypothetical protein
VKLSDFEWLRFVTFAFVASGIVGSVTTGAFILNGMPVQMAMAGSAAWGGAIAVVLHLTMRRLLADATASSDDQQPEEDTA